MKILYKAINPYLKLSIKFSLILEKIILLCFIHTKLENIKNPGKRHGQCQGNCKFQTCKKWRDGNTHCNGYQNCSVSLCKTTLNLNHN